MLRSMSIGFPADTSGLVICPFSFPGCSFCFNQSALSSVFCGPGGSFFRYQHIVGSSVFELDCLSAIVTLLKLIHVVGVTVATCLTTSAKTKLLWEVLESSSEMDKIQCISNTEHSQDTKITVMAINFPARKF